ncbi:hypothetical protein CCACVL1_25911, partial [Corchorus capsularis]
VSPLQPGEGIKKGKRKKLEYKLEEYLSDREDASGNVGSVGGTGIGSGQISRFMVATNK